MVEMTVSSFPFTTRICIQRTLQDDAHFSDDVEWRKFLAFLIGVMQSCTFVGFLLTASSQPCKILQAWYIVRHGVVLHL